VFPAGFSIAERPHIPKAMGSAPFDDEGVATRDRELVADGILTGYILSSYSARKLGLQTTGNAGGAHNLVVAPTLAGGMEALLARLGTGLLVTELMGQGVNMVTGDYSRGAAGFWVENGALQYPVAEITIAGNLRDMLKGVAAVGDDVDARGSTRVGSILVTTRMRPSSPVSPLRPSPRAARRPAPCGAEHKLATLPCPFRM
jgi:PmbA protein